MSQSTAMQEITREYEQIRFANRQLRDARILEIHEQVPEIAKCDDEIRDINLSAALHLSEDVSDAQLKEQTDALIRKKYVLLTAAGYPKDYLAPIYTCPRCHDTGYVDNQPCDCLKRRIVATQYAQSNLATLLQTQNYENFRMDYYAAESDGTHPISPRDNMGNILAAIKNYEETIGDYLSGDQSIRGNLLLYGPSGVGKSFLSCCVAKTLLDRGYAVVYTTAYHLFEQIGDAIYNKGQFSGSDVFYHAVESCDVLIIDDLGTEMTNQFILTQLYNTVNERLLHHKSTIISTNLRMADLQDRYSERVASRLVEHYKILGIYGDDIRLLKRTRNSSL